MSNQHLAKLEEGKEKFCQIENKTHKSVDLCELF